MRLQPDVVAVTPPVRIGLVRLLVGGYTLLYLAPRRRMFHRVATTDPELFAPVGPVRVLDRPLSPRVAGRVLDATLGSTVLFTLGVGHPVVSRLHTALLTWTLAYRNSWSMIHHNDNLVVLHTLVLSVGRSADAVSVDAALRTAGGHAAPAPAARYGWPLTLMNAVTAAAYLLAGIAKVAGASGWGWVRGDALRRQVAVDGLRKQVYGSRASELAYRLYPHRRLFGAMAVVALLVELGAPLAMADRRLGRVWVAAAYGMHWGILAVMGITFRYQLSGVAFASWWPVERVLPSVRRRGSR